MRFRCLCFAVLDPAARALVSCYAFQIFHTFSPLLFLGCRNIAAAMVGYCSKDEGRAHYQSCKKGVSRAEVNVALAEYRKIQRACVSEDRVELGKKNFWGLLRRFRCA